MTLDYGLLDSVLVWKYASGEIVTAGLSKIINALSLPLVGALFDLKKGNLRSLITVCAMFFVAVATPAAAEDAPKACPQCGAPVSDDALFCNKCGAQL